MGLADQDLSVPTGPFDADGVPRDEPVGGWFDLGDPANMSDRTGDLGRLLATLRFSRADGSAMFGPRGKDLGRIRRMTAWADRLGDGSLAGILARWTIRRGGGPAPVAPAPSPSHSCGDRVLAVLRPDWSPTAEVVAIDHRVAGPVSVLEVGSKGRTWLGPTWSSATGGKACPALPTARFSGPYAECVEWSYQAGSTRTTRVAVLLKGQGLAILGQQEDGPARPIEARFGLPDGIEAIPDAELRGLTLTSGRGKPAARLIPLGLPCSPYSTERGSIAVEGREVVVRQAATGGRRRWLTVVVSWGPLALGWRPLTVACRSKACPGAVAAAARVAWKPKGGSLVVYRSLAPPDLRSFLGHQTRARFVVGSFDPSGDVRPLAKLD